MERKKCTACEKTRAASMFEKGKRQCRECRYEIRKARTLAKRMDDFNRLMGWPAPMEVSTNE